MKNVKINNSKRRCIISITTIDKSNNCLLLTATEWGRKNKLILPPYYSNDYSFILHKKYQQYLIENQNRIQKYSYDILLNNVEIKQNVSFTRIFITFQQIFMQGNLQLVLKKDESDAITLCDLKDIRAQLNLSKRFIFQKIEFAHALNLKIPDFCISQGQKLMLRITGGFLLKDSVLVCSKLHL